MAYTISLEIFEGPLDLLLYLIQKHKIDIYNIPIAEVTEQYLGYLQTMQELDLEIASEFLLMASTLLAIKAKMLLPQTTKEEQDEESIDPRKELVEQLIEYQRFKNITDQLKMKKAKQALLFSRPFDPIYNDTVLKNLNPLDNITIDNLKDILKLVLAEISEEEVEKEIPKRVITVKDKMEYIERLVKEEPQGILFRDLLAKSTSTLVLIVTFLALLELVHFNKVFVIQTTNFGPLRIFPKIPRSEEHHAI